MQQKTCLLLVTALTLLLVGCGSEEAKPMTSATSTYLDMAQDFIEKGDYESAKRTNPAVIVSSALTYIITLSEKSTFLPNIAKKK